MKESSYKRDVTCRRQQPEDEKPPNRPATINFHRNVFALKKKPRISEGFRGATRGDQPTHRPTDRTVTTSADVLQRFRFRGLQPDGVCQSTSRGRISGTTDGRTATKVGRWRGREREPGRRSGRAIFFSSIELPGDADRASLTSDARSSIYLVYKVILARFTPPTIPISLSLSLSFSVCLILSFSMRFILLSKSQPTHRIHAYTIGANLPRFTHALIRGFRSWWEEADGRRRGARTWPAKIYGAGVSVWKTTQGWKYILYTCI